MAVLKGEKQLKNLRPLYIAKILFERTDENHSLSTPELIAILNEEYGIAAHRVTIYEDIEQLRQFGLDIYTVKSSKNRYYLASRLFDLPELKLLIDAVESSKFITAKKSRELVAKLGKLTSRNNAGALQRNLCPEERIKPENEKIYYIVDAIHEAINSKRKISFQYFRYNGRKHRVLRHNGQRYVFSPWMLVWNGDYYYMLGYSDDHDEITSFRVDRIAGQPEILEEPTVSKPRGFSAAKHINTMFRMYTGERKKIELLCADDTMDAFIDRFGEGIKTARVNEDHFRATIELAPNHIFYSWIFGFGGKVKIIAPEDIRAEYAHCIRDAIEHC